MVKWNRGVACVVNMVPVILNNIETWEIMTLTDTECVLHLILS